jgi:hypothetical protein
LKSAPRQRNPRDFLQFSAMAQFFCFQRFISSVSSKMINCNAPNAKFVATKKKLSARDFALMRRRSDADFVEKPSAI